MTNDDLLKETYALTHLSADTVARIWQGIEQGQPVTPADATRLLEQLRRANASALRLSEIIHQRAAR